MSQKVAPAPWYLKGQGYVMVVQLPIQVLDNESFIEPSLKSTRRGHLAYIAFADYESSEVGAYHELLYIGGTLKFDQKRHLSISKIYVSTQDSIGNGQKNWGIPKEMAQFEVQYGADNHDIVKLSTPSGDTIAQFSFSHHLFKFPVNTKLAPTRLRTLAQDWQGQRFFFPLQAEGYVKPALLKACYVDKRYFTDLNQGHVIACFKVTDFSMVFPVPKTQAL
jgi:hypothetical protein